MAKRASKSRACATADVRTLKTQAKKKQRVASIARTLKRTEGRRGRRRSVLACRWIRVPENLKEQVLRFTEPTFGGIRMIPVSVTVPLAHAPSPSFERILQIFIRSRMMFDGCLSPSNTLPHRRTR